MSKSKQHKQARRADSATRTIRYASFAQPGTSKTRVRTSDVKLIDQPSQRLGRKSRWEMIVANTPDKF